ncbi:MAG: DegV family protein [Bacteroides sp.]|nr:DegV family protein [Eubacterium sp.]MCM1418638.1 DegV family protein [Roseburia sp.]MCM1462692.1 DegV family protein [Bacteroides sp.]
MTKIAITTDTNSSMTREEADRLGVFLLPMPFIIDGKEYFEDVTCTYDEFFERLAAGAEVSTSQPSPGSLTELWDRVLTEYDALVHIPMSSAISSSTATAKALSAEYGGRVFVADNRRISPTQHQSVHDALDMVKAGMSASEICEKLEETSYHASIYLAVNTLELLKKSGRVTAAGAAIATILNLKPVLQIQGGKLDAFAKARGMANAEKIMLDAAKKDKDERFAGIPIKIAAAYSGELAPALEWKKTVEANFPGYDVILHRLPISISCHVGAGVKAIVCMRYFEGGKEKE